MTVTYMDHELSFNWTHKVQKMYFPLNFLIFKLIHHTISIFLVLDKFHLKTVLFIFFSPLFLWKRLSCPAAVPAFFPQALFL